MYLKMDRVGYYIFVNLLVNHITNNVVEYRQFILIFEISRNSCFVHHFVHAIKNNFFCSII